MKKIFTYLSAILIICMTGCSKGGGGNDSGTLATVTTAAITSITHNSAIGGGTVTSEGGSTVFNSGLCWNTSPDPNLSNFNSGLGSGAGTYSGSLTSLQPNTTYYVRAYASNNKGTAYGNTVTFTTVAAPAISVTTEGGFTIISKSATLRGVSVQPAGTFIMDEGFVYRTTPNPNITNATVASLGFSIPIGTYSKDITGLTPNTTYYVKAYARNSNNDYVYGAEMTFKTTGYFGASGGYVFYDKGESTNGWRYLEVAPVNLHYNISFSTGAKFGCVGTNLTNTYPDIGKGLENTNQIINNCGNANCAARLCAFYSVSGINGWFLPSKEETFLLVRSLYPMGVLVADDYWTSTELTQNNAVKIDWDLATSAFVDYSHSKDWYGEVRPVRRY